MERTGYVRITSLILALVCLLSLAAAALGTYECLRIRRYAAREEAHAQDVSEKMTNLIALLRSNEQSYIAALGTFVFGGIIFESEYALEWSEEELASYEEAMALVDEYTGECFRAPELESGGVFPVQTPEQRLGEDYDWRRYDDAGELRTLRSGDPWLDFDRCTAVCKAYLRSHSEWNDGAQKETGERLALCAALAAAAAIGLVSAYLALRGKGAAAIMSIFLLLLAAQAHAFGFVCGYTGFAFSVPDFPPTGAWQLAALWLFTAAALAFAIAVGRSRARAKRAAELAGEPVYKTESTMIKSETRRRALGAYDEALRKYRNGNNSKH